MPQHPTRIPHITVDRRLGPFRFSVFRHREFSDVAFRAGIVEVSAGRCGATRSLKVNISRGPIRWLVLFLSPKLSLQLSRRDVDDDEGDPF